MSPWEWKKLGDVCEVIAGQSPQSSAYNSDGVGLEFHQGKKAFGKRVIQPSKVWTKEYTKIAKKGDILMSVRAPVGPVNFTDREICIGRGLAAIRNTSALDENFLFYYFINNESKMTSKVGAVFDSINRSDIQNFVIPVPPLAEQKRIVKTLDEKFFKIDKLKTAAETNLKNAKNLFQKKLEQIINEACKENSLVALKDVTTKIGSGATPKGGQKSYQSEGIALIRSLNVRHGFFTYEDLAHINDNQAKALDGVTIQINDVLFNITGASIARCCVVPNDVVPARVNQHVSILRPNQTLLNSVYLSNVLLAPQNQKKLLGIGEAGATRQALTKTDLEMFQIPLPPLSEQKRIVAHLDKLSEKVKRLEEIYRRTIADCEELKKSILKKTFEGES